MCQHEPSQSNQIKPMSLDYQSLLPPFSQTISINRLIVCRNLKILGILAVILGMCAGGGVMFENQPVPPTEPTSFALGLSCFVTLEFLGITYLICDRKIKMGGYRSVCIALILAIIVELFALFMLLRVLMNLLAIAKGTGLSLSLALAVLVATIPFMYAFATGQLIYYSIRILCERHKTSPGTGMQK